MKNNYIKTLIAPQYTFFVISILGIIGFFIYAALHGKYVLMWVLQEPHPILWGTDFFLHMKISGYDGNIYSHISEVTNYSGWGTFPPLAYCIYRFFYCLANDFGNETDLFNTLYTNYYIYTLFLIFSIAILLLSIKYIYINNVNISKSNIFIFCLLCSAPLMWSGFFIGNSVIIVWSLLLLSLYLKDSASIIHKEISIILLAICIGLKIYPAILGLLYLKEKRYNELIRLFLYGIIFLFGPFICFGGIDGILTWIGHIVNAIKIQEYNRVQYIKGICFFILTTLTNNKDNILIQLIPSIASAFFLFIMIILAWMCKNKNRTIFFLICAMVFVPNLANRYSLNYLAIPLAFWIQERHLFYTMRDWIFGICNGLIFTVPIWFGLMTKFRLHYVDFWLYGVAYLLVLAEVLFELQAIWRTRKFTSR